MRIASLLIILFLCTHLYAKTKITFAITNPFTYPVNIEVRNGGKLKGLSIEAGAIATQTIQSNSSANLSVKVNQKDLISIVGSFPDGSQCLYGTYQVPGKEQTFSINLIANNQQKLKSAETYLSDLENTFYQTSDLQNQIIINADADNVFSTTIGAIAIIQRDTKGVAHIVNQINSDVLRTNMAPEYSKDGSKSYQYILTSDIATKNKGNIPGFGTTNLGTSNASHYQFNYSVVGLGKIVTKDSGGISAIARFNRLSEEDKKDFFLTLANDTFNKLEVQVITQALVVKGMYLKIQQLKSSSIDEDINASTFFTNSGSITLSNSAVYEEVYGPKVLSIGFDGQNKTPYFRAAAKEYLKKIQTLADASQMKIKLTGDSSRITITGTGTKSEINQKVNALIDKIDLSISKPRIKDEIEYIKYKVDKRTRELDIK